MHLRRVQERRQFRHGRTEGTSRRFAVSISRRHCRTQASASWIAGCEPRLAVDQKQKRPCGFEEHGATIRVGEDAGQRWQRWFAVVKLPGSAGDY
jgi:hypothetical protein